MIAIARPTANQVAEELTGRSYVSFSSLRTFRECPLRYYFRYIAGLPEETVAAGLVFGSAIHRALETHFRELLSGNRPPSLDALLAEYHGGWSDRGEQQVLFGKGEDQNSLAMVARRILVAFQASELACPAGTILGVEEELRENVIPGLPDVLARLDLVVETDRAVVVTDFKTARARWSQEQAEDAGEQLLLYSELAKQLVPGKPVKLEFAVVTKTKVPAIERHEIELVPQRVARMKRVVRRVWRAIEAGHFYPAPSPLSCPTCPFRKPCRKWTG